ncbi:MAG: carboxypeptidase-like regulatory domain-containing protein [Bacteroidota bacterium]
MPGRFVSEYRQYAVLARIFSLLLFLSATHDVLYSQTFRFKGIVKDDQTSEPIRDARISEYGSKDIISTGSDGSFALKIGQTPATLVFSCAGYDLVAYTVNANPGKPVEFRLRGRSWQLPEAEMPATNFTWLYSSKVFSVLDYEIMEDNLILLIFRDQLARSELALIARSGDTLTFSPLPEYPPAGLFKDFLGKVHYFSKAKNAFRFQYSEQHNWLEFFPRKTVDSLQIIAGPFVFKIGDRLYFRETVAQGFGTAFGYYEKGAVKKYIRRFQNEAKISESPGDQIFYRRWLGMQAGGNLPDPDNLTVEAACDFSALLRENGANRKNKGRMHWFEFNKMSYPLFNLGSDTIAFFNFAVDSLELMDKDGKRYKQVPIKFHMEGKPVTGAAATVRLSDSAWRWAGTVMRDDFTHGIYTLFRRNGMVRVRKVDLATGKLLGGSLLPFASPEKIKIYRGYAFFLVKGPGPDDKWKLVKCKL